MRERLAADKKDIPDVHPPTDVQHAAHIFECNEPNLILGQTTDGEVAKLTMCIARICDGELEVPRTAVFDDLSGQSSRVPLRSSSCRCCRPGLVTRCKRYFLAHDAFSRTILEAEAGTPPALSQPHGHGIVN